ncbi:hypothetical protein PDM87_29995 [Bacillus cereus]|nr:hypothetical protein [Bacillus cereus]
MGLVKPFPTIDTKTKRLPQTNERPLYYKVARIQSRNPVDSAEGSVLQGQLFPQSNFGFTGTAQPLYTFSFGVRNGGSASFLKPSLLKVGDSREDSYRFEVYKDPEGFHFLYLVLSSYSRGGVIVYHSIECKEYFEVDMEFTERGYTLVWSSETGDTQGVYEGGRRLLTEKKAETLYTSNDDSKSIVVSLDTGLSDPFYHTEAGLRVTKQNSVVVLNGMVFQGYNGKNMNIGKVPLGYEPKQKTMVAGAYTKKDGSFAPISLLVKTDGYISMLADRVDTGDPLIMYINGSWILKP